MFISGGDIGWEMVEWQDGLQLVAPRGVWMGLSSIAWTGDVGSGDTLKV